MIRKILDVVDLQVQIQSDEREVTIVDHLSFHIHAQETVGIVGESGCGKSLTSLSIIRLLPAPLCKITNGQILFNGQNLLEASEADMRKIRGNQISMIFQDPMTSLNPAFTVGRQIDEVILLHQDISRKAAKEKTTQMLNMVGISRPQQIYDSYPFELSGGMRQRVMIAMGMVCEPNLLIADEPTTALDVTIQAQILELMKELKEQVQTSILLITHDLGIVAEMCDRVMVMYAGRIVEEASVDELFYNPKHPYTRGLLASIPSSEVPKEKLYSIPGQVPQAGAISGGCAFAPRCEAAFEPCWQRTPNVTVLAPDHRCSCWLYE